MATCTKCNVSSSDRADWDEYSGMCPECSYAEHRTRDDAEFRHTFDQVGLIGRWMAARSSPPAELVVSTARTAAEVLVRAWDVDPSGTVDHAARQCLGLALLLLDGAPRDLVDHHMQMVEGAIRRARES